MNNIWQGRIIKLRAVEESDLDNYFCDGGPIDTDGQLKGDRAIFPVSKDLMRGRVSSLATANPYDEEFFMIIENKDGEAVGNINTHSTSRIDGTFQFGVGIKPNHRSKGYASDAIRVLMRFYFMELGYQKVETRVYGFNMESHKLHESLEFVVEGNLRRSHYALGKWHDVTCYGMTREEFKDKNMNYFS